MYRLLSAVLICLLLCTFPAAAISSSEQEDKGFLSDIEQAVKDESRQIKGILDSQTDKASRNLIIIAGAIIVPICLLFLLWSLKLIFNISISAIRSLFNISATGAKRLQEAVNKPVQKPAEEENKPKRKPLKLGEILVRFVSRSLNTEHITIALSEQKRDPNRPKLGEILVKQGLATNGEIEAALKIQGKKL
ncbi:MAG: hypothetical protein HY279_11615 [Nitrospinae bacterium]|nr:hypothetical protein [Nitrospinota bacterium]